MNKIKKLLVASSLLLAGTNAWSVAGWSSYGDVVELTPTIHGRFLVKINVSSNPSGCRNSNWFYRDHFAGSDQIFLLLLEAVSSGKKVRVYVTGVCDINDYSEISSASIFP